MSGTARGWMLLGLLAGWGGASLLAEDAPERARTRPAADVRRALRELRSASLSPPSAPPDDDLQRTIRRLRALRLRRTGQGPPELAPKPAATAPAPTSAPAAHAGHARLDGPLTPHLLKRIAAMPPKDVSRPSALADALFLAGKPEQAFRFYEAAFEETHRRPEGRAWLLYQMANCRRAYDPPGSRQIYKRLLAEYPESTWAPLAEVQHHLTEWYEVNKPRELVEATAGGTRGP